MTRRDPTSGDFGYGSGHRVAELARVPAQGDATRSLATSVTVAWALLACLLLPAWGRAESASFDSDGVKIHYVVEGEGEPVLLIHGFAASVPTQWMIPGVLRALARDHHVIALDNRGHGLSDKPHDPKQYGVQTVEDVVRLLDHLRIRKVHVVGYSMGAMIACKLLSMHPERVQSVVLGGAAGVYEGADTTFFARLADDLEHDRGIGVLLAALAPEGHHVDPERMRQANKWLSLFFDTKALAATVRGWDELTVSGAKLKANKVPVLGLVGELDPLKKNEEEMQERLTNMKLEVIPGADHMNAFAHPEFVRAVKRFLAAHAMHPKATMSPALVPTR